MKLLIIKESRAYIILLFLILTLLAGCQSTKSIKASNKILPTVVIIPGVMGTELFMDDATKVWPPRIPLIGKDFERIHLDAAGLPVKKGIREGLPFASDFKVLFDSMVAQGYETYFFGYDWRLDNSASAKKLHEFLGNLDSREIYIIAHSMGGLVTTQYIKEFGKGNITKVVMIGTPFIGAVGLLKDLETGAFLGNGILGQLTKSHFSRLLRNQPSWYQLLPGEKYFEYEPDGFILKTVIDGKEEATTSIDCFNETLSFLSSRGNINSQLLKSEIYFTDRLDTINILGQVDPYFIVGSGYPTISHVEYVYRLIDGEKVFDRVNYAATNEGDGRVLSSSALIGGEAWKYFSGKVFIYKESHSGLLSNKAVIRKILGIFSGK